jgi:hypothetical protein
MNSLIETLRDSNEALGVDHALSISGVFGSTSSVDSIEIVEDNRQSNLSKPERIPIIDVVQAGIVDELANPAKIKFYQLLYQNEDFRKKLIYNKSIIKRKDEYLALVAEVKAAYSAKAQKTKHDRRQTYLWANYATLKVDGDERLISKIEMNQPKPKVYTWIERLYDDILTEHIAIGHGARDKTYKQCQVSYENITVTAVVIWLQTCLECIVNKRKNTTSNVVFTTSRISGQCRAFEW